MWLYDRQLANLIEGLQYRIRLNSSINLRIAFKEQSQNLRAILTTMSRSSALENGSSFSNSNRRANALAVF